MFNDPLAKDLAAPHGFELLERHRGGGLLEFIAIRTRYFDDSTREILRGSPIRQVVFVAAGMDTRAFRLPWPPGCTVYEVDHQALIEEKGRRLMALGAKAACDRREVCADLAGDWLPSLQAAGFDRGKPTLWVAEGLMFFLTEEQARELLTTLASASAPGSWLVVDFASKALLRSPFSQGFLKSLRDSGTPWRFGTDEPADFLAAVGWKTRELKEPGEAGAGEGRWSYQLLPRDRRGVPRSWLLRAERSDLSQCIACRAGSLPDRDGNSVSPVTGLALCQTARGGAVLDFRTYRPECDRTRDYVGKSGGYS